MLKPITGESEHGFSILLGFSCCQAVLLGFCLRKNQKNLLFWWKLTHYQFYFFTCFAPSLCSLFFLCSVLFLSSFSPNSWCDLLSTAQLFPQGQVTESKHRVTGWKKKASLWIAPMLTSSESLHSLACKEIVLDTEQVCKAGSLEGRESQHFGCLEGLGVSLSVLDSLRCQPYWLHHLQTLLEEDHQLRDTWIKNCCLPGMGDQCIGLLVQQSKSREGSLLGKDPRPSFQGSNELNSAATDRTVAFKATEELALHLSGIWLTSKLLASWQVTKFWHLFLMHVFTLLQ